MPVIAVSQEMPEKTATNLYGSGISKPAMFAMFD